MADKILNYEAIYKGFKLKPKRSRKRINSPPFQKKEGDKQKNEQKNYS